MEINRASLSKKLKPPGVVTIHAVFIHPIHLCQKGKCIGG